MKRSYRNGDHLTDDELAFMMKTAKCPDCETGKLYEGPSGGISTNFICGNCPSRFNLHAYGQAGADRISDSSRDPETAPFVVEKLPKARVSRPGFWQWFFSLFRRTA